MRKNLLLATLVLGAVAVGCQSDNREERLARFAEETEGSRAKFQQRFEDMKNPQKNIEKATKFAIQELRLNASEIKFIKANEPIIESNVSNTFAVFYWELPSGEGIEVLSSGTSMTMIEAKRGLRGMIIPE